MFLLYITQRTTVKYIHPKQTSVILHKTVGVFLLRRSYYYNIHTVNRTVKLDLHTSQNTRRGISQLKASVRCGAPGVLGIIMLLHELHKGRRIMRGSFRVMGQTGMFSRYRRQQLYCVKLSSKWNGSGYGALPFTSYFQSNVLHLGHMRVSSHFC